MDELSQKKHIGSESPSRRLRKVILPAWKSSGYDVVSASPYGITCLNRQFSAQGERKCQLAHSGYCIYSSEDDITRNDASRWEASFRDAVGCSFQGFLYLVAEDGFFVVLPSVSVSSDFFPVEAIGYRQVVSHHQLCKDYEFENWRMPWSPPKVEVLDRVLISEGPEEADVVCLENGWDLKISRIRRLQLALHYLKFEEVEKSLEMLAMVDLAEEGILRLLFAAVYLILQKFGNDNEVSAALRLLALATAFSTRTIRVYGMLHQKRDDLEDKDVKDITRFSFLSQQVDLDHEKERSSKRLCEMARFLEIIRNLQLRLNARFRRPSDGQVEGTGAIALVNDNLSEYDQKLHFSSTDALSAGAPLNMLESGRDLDVTEKLSLTPVALLDPKPLMNSENSDETSLVLSDASRAVKRIFPLENPKDMIARWEFDKLDLTTIVKDALFSGRLPLAVLKLHLHRLKDLVRDTESQDLFNEVRDVGKSISYGLFLKGETELAVTTLQKLGEDAETCLKQLFFGSVRRALRIQIAEVMKRYGYLGPHEWRVLERISLIERVYPCSNFWSAFNHRQKELKSEADGIAQDGIHLHIFYPLKHDVSISCGEIDGVVLGSWVNENEQSIPPDVDADSSHSAYWSAAAVWSEVWDQQIVDRIVLDQPFLMGVNILWESQLEYYMWHNDWFETSKLLEMVPSYALSSGNLRIRSDSISSSSAVEYSLELTDYRFCPVGELDTMGFTVPCVRILALSTLDNCSVWLKMLVEEQLSKKFIFVKDYWESNAEMVHLLARSGFVSNASSTSFLEEPADSSSDISIMDEAAHPDALLSLHKLVIRYCTQFNLPHLLDLYLDHQKLAEDHTSLSLMLDSVGDTHWAKWLIFQRVKGKEYDASFSNARAIASRDSRNNLSVLEIDDVIHTVDDIAEGAGEIAALATLMYTPAPIQDCLTSGSVNRQGGSTQCTLENLRPALQRFPTLWRTLVAACFNQDPIYYSLSPKPRLPGVSELSDYLDWRENVFFSSGRDTSLLQMLPCWFPKAVRRLIQLYVEGPLGWHSLAAFPSGDAFLPQDIGYLISSHSRAEISAISWEAAIQQHIEEELSASSLKVTGHGLEHHLHRGRPLAAFYHILTERVKKLKLESTQGASSSSAHGQGNVQSDVHTFLAPINQSEESLLSSVLPLAIAHFEESVLVSSCAFLLELCGLSAGVLRVDVAALRRISYFYKSANLQNQNTLHSPKGSTFHSASVEGNIAESLARAMADEYLHNEYSGGYKRNPNQDTITEKRSSPALMLVLQHLEKSSLPSLVEGVSCGSWLSNDMGDGAELRAQQKAASQHWNLVTLFCQMHDISLSSKYLALLARDNDWVGFLSEAQVGGYPFETVLQVASTEFSDPRLRIHILTVLKSMQSQKMSNSDATSSAGDFFTRENFFVPVELFTIIAECEKQKDPGEALLVKAKNLSWSILAVIASCFPDVSPLSCLTMWLEITAARETSAIKVNDIASRMANNVGAAVEATNCLPANSRAHSFHYNRINPKRRRLVEPILMECQSGVASDKSTIGYTTIQDIFIEDNKPQANAQEMLTNPDDVAISLSKMVAVLCEKQLFPPLLRAFEMFLPSCSIVPFIRALQAFSQMRLSEASAHLGSFSLRIKEEHINSNNGRELQIGNSWISSTALKAADAVLSTCPSPYERRCFLQLLAVTDFGDGGSAMIYYKRLYWKINLAEPELRSDECLDLGDVSLDDASLLNALEKNRYWDQARSWAQHLEATGGSWKSVAHNVTEKQAESMVAEWKEFLWDVPEERNALWGHCQTLFLRHSFPALQAGLFFLKHAEAAEKDLPPRELHELLLLALQWLSGTITHSSPVCPLHLLREIETRVWLLAVDSEGQVKSDREFTLTNSSLGLKTGKTSNNIDRTASVVTKMDNHIQSSTMKSSERNDHQEHYQSNSRTSQAVESGSLASTDGTMKTKRRAKGLLPSRRILLDVENNNECEGSTVNLNLRDNSQCADENWGIGTSFSRWEERVGPTEVERAVLSLLEVGQIAAARQLQQKLSPGNIPPEFLVVDASLKLAATSTPIKEIPVSVLDIELRSILQSYNLLTNDKVIDPLQILESLANIITVGNGRGLCKRIVSVVKSANVLGLSFSEAFVKQPLELLQLLSLKAQESFDEANLLVQTHSMPAASIAQILAESFLKGLLAAHRGGYMDSQKEEGPAPLLWRFSDFLKWAQLCPSEPEIGHALMRLVITGQDIPHACEVELLILSHHFYKSSACLDGVDVLVALAATRVEAYVSEGDFACLARLVTGVGNFHALNFILGILVENGQLDLLLQKYSAAADANTGTAQTVRGFRMAVLTSLNQINPNDVDAFAMVYNHFDMKHETASLLESRAGLSAQQWFQRYDKDQNEDLLDSMRYFIEAAEVYSSIDAGNKTHGACAQASLVSLQIRMPDNQWLNLSATNARRALVEQSRFQEALIVAEAYGLNQPSEWALVLWNQMLNPELTEQFVAEFVAVLPLRPSMLVEIARFYRAEVAARGDQNQFSMWLTGGGLPADWSKYLARSFRCLLKRTTDLRLRLQLATIATSFIDIVESCNRTLDKVPENAGPLVLRKGHGGAYLPLM
ncbi:hypothetical protein Leryth_015660 [Lithospermum erythrorhizon]|nr:hypothetical protein Leryth_015660 [Lithospermum erythrorhizon]